MEPRKNTLHETLEKMYVISEGTITGTYVRGITWPLENAFYILSQKNRPPSSLEVYRHNFKPKTLLELNKIFFKTGFLQTIMKSSTSIGCMSYIDEYHPDYTAYQKSCTATIVTTPLETLFTSRSEYYKVKDFLESKNAHAIKNNRLSLFSAEYSRVFSATFIRVLWSSIITFGGIYKTTEWIQPYFSNKNRAYAKPIAAFISCFSLQPFIMPIINYQTYILKNPHIPIIKNTKKFISEHSLRELTYGALHRGIHRSLYYTLALGIADAAKNRRQKNNLK